MPLLLFLLCKWLIKDAALLAAFLSHQKGIILDSQHLACIGAWCVFLLICHDMLSSWHHDSFVIFNA